MIHHDTLKKKYEKHSKSIKKADKTLMALHLEKSGFPAFMENDSFDRAYSEKALFTEIYFSPAGSEQPRPSTLASFRSHVKAFLSYRSLP